MILGDPMIHQKLSLCVWQLGGLTYPRVVPMLPTGKTLRRPASPYAKAEAMFKAT